MRTIGPGPLAVVDVTAWCVAAGAAEPSTDRCTALEVAIVHPGASPRAVERDGTLPIGCADAITGAKRIRSRSWGGSFRTMVEMRRDADTRPIEPDRRERLRRLRSHRPADARTPAIDHSVQPSIRG